MGEDKKRVYIAGPFFNPDQVLATIRVESILKEESISFFSPRLECFCPPDASREVRAEVFGRNLQAIADAELVLARIDDFDPGTIFEMGWAFACCQHGEGPQIVAWTVKEKGRGLNLMLAEGCAGFLQGYMGVVDFFHRAPKKGDFNWEVAKKWHANII